MKMKNIFKVNCIIIIIVALILSCLNRTVSKAQEVIKVNGYQFLDEEKTPDPIVNELTNPISLQKIQEKKEEELAKKEEADRKAKLEAEKAKINKFSEPVTLYAIETAMIRNKPENENNIVDQVKAGDAVTCIASIKGTEFYMTSDNNYISSDQLNEDKWYFTYNHEWEGAKLNTIDGVVLGPNGYESYYNLPMGGIVSIMRSMGFSEDEYPYWVRDDGCKMLGNYIMVAADLDKYPRGSTSMCSLGQCIICDTGGFIYSTNRTFDVAVAW